MIAQRWKTLVVIAVVMVSMAHHSTPVTAHGVGPQYVVLRSGLFPADHKGFAEGHLAVVRAGMARRYLVQAYRVMSAQGVLPNRDDGSGLGASNGRFSYRDAGADWLNASERVLGIKTEDTGRQWRWFHDFKDLPSGAFFQNCSSDALATAMKTLTARSEQFGAGSEYVKTWTQGQVDVFANCESETLKLPSPVPSTADPMLRADRAYQIAAAYFYATQYDTAAEHFRAIANDARSPWRSYGRYLAARALLRKATIHDADTMPAARKEFEAVVADPSLAVVHASARGLIDFINVRLQTDVTLRSLGEALTTGAASRDQLVEYVAVMDRVVGDTVRYEYASIPDLELVRAHDLTDWITAFQGSGPESLERAAVRWKATKSLPWLIAFLSKIDAPHADAAAALDAASRVPAESPAYQTVLVGRVRAMAAIGRRAEAKALFATLPMRATATIQEETVNELQGFRQQMADSYVEFWRSTPREVAAPVRTTRRVRKDGRENYETVEFPTNSRPVFDDESAAVINEHLPLARLVDAALSTDLPDHLRRRLAAAAFTRAIMLGRHDDAMRVAPVLARLSPALGSDLRVYLSAAPGKQRERAALLLVLRTPGLNIDAPGQETEEAYVMDNPPTTIGGWWCAAGDAKTPAPRFVAAADLTARKDEHRVLGAAPGLQHFSQSLFEWSREEPANPLVAEALSRFVNGWRRACRIGANDSPAPKRAFDTLHRQFPGSEWARRTRFWYR